jgi:hypothetical protein
MVIFTDAEYDLALALDFTPEDLASNQDGTLTDRQMDYLQSVLRRDSWPGLIMLSVLGAFVGTLAWIGRGIWLLGLLIIILMGAWDAYTLRRRLRSLYSIKTLDFVISKKHSWQVENQTLVFFDEMRRFDVPPHFEEILQKGATYRLYYSPLAKNHILSIRRVYNKDDQPI